VDTLRLGETLDRDLGDRWGRLSAPGLHALLAYEGAEVWLFRRLRGLGALDALPPDFRNPLKARAVEIAALGLHIEDEAVAAVRCLLGAGIPVILIKGTARRALAERYPYLDARPTQDVDLLLPSERLREGHELLRARGYLPATGGPPTPPHHHHLPGLWSERKVSIELHESVSMRVPPAIAWARASAGSEEIEWGGLRVRVPGPTELTWGAIAHALGDVIVSGFRLRHFLEVAALIAGKADVDWGVVKARSTSGEVYDPVSGIAYPPLVILAWLDAALALVSVDLRPADLDRPALDLIRLLEWRLAVFRSSSWLRGALRERLLEEGPRALIGLPLGTSPESASWPKRIRRHAAGRASRVLFQAWRVALAN